MSLSIRATFKADTLTTGPEMIGFQGPAATGPLAKFQRFERAGGIALGLVATQTSPNEIKPKIKKMKIYPVESYYLNGAQYLTGGVGNRLAFDG